MNGCKRVVKKYYHDTDMSLSNIQVSVASGLYHVCIIHKNVMQAMEKDQISVSDGSSELANRIEYAIASKDNEGVEKGTKAYNENVVERAILEGIEYAIKAWKMPNGSLNPVFGRALPTIKDLKEYYEKTDSTADVSQPSDEEA